VLGCHYGHHQRHDIRPLFCLTAKARVNAKLFQLDQDLIAVMAEMGMAADLEHVTDIAEIGSYGVMGTPALVVNGTLKALGSIPPKTKLKQWLQDAFAKQSGK
jgi:hypothetical protein